MKIEQSGTNRKSARVSYVRVIAENAGVGDRCFPKVSSRQRLYRLQCPDETAEDLKRPVSSTRRGSDSYRSPETQHRSPIIGIDHQIRRDQ